MCGILSAGSFGSMALHVALDPAEARRDAELEPALGHQLRADADAEERPAFAAHGLLQRLAHAGDRIDARPAVGEGADARQHDAVGGQHVGRIGASPRCATSASLSRAARSKAFAAECRLPEP